MSLGFERYLFVRLESPDHLLEKIVLNDDGSPIASCDFEPCGGYPSDPQGWLFYHATFYQYIGALMCLEYM
jgi:hypothetical protein